jgi:hypothetical protein
VDGVFARWDAVWMVKNDKRCATGVLTRNAPDAALGGCGALVGRMMFYYPGSNRVVERVRHWLQKGDSSDGQCRYRLDHRNPS